MDVNDDAGILDARVALGFFASVLAPTGDPEEYDLRRFFLRVFPQ
jgi:hypothetical protein